MKVQFLASSVGDDSPNQFLTTYLINDSIAIDAGSLGLIADIARQRRVNHVLLSHSHVDHVLSLPIFLENVFTPDGVCPTIHCSAEVEHSLRHDLFNDRVWPDFIRLSTEHFAFLRLRRLQAEAPLAVEGLKITPVAVDHAVPTLGFMVDDGTSVVVIASDTGPTHRLWELVNREPRVTAVFLESAFPNAMQSLATAAAHHTPTTFGEDVRKFRRSTRVFAVHLKPAYRQQLIDEINDLCLANVEICEPNRVYDL